MPWRSRGWRSAARCVVLTVGLIALAPGAAQAAIGDLLQKPGLAGCIADTGFAGACIDGTALDRARDVAVSPDGRNAYAAAQDSDAVAIFDRTPATGALTQKLGTAGCLSETGGACADGKALDGAASVTVSPDGRNVYVASRDAALAGSDGVAVFDRDPATGALTQKAGTAGCITDNGSSAACTDGKGLANAGTVTVSPDGENVYVAPAAGSGEPGAIAVFDRDGTTGALTQKSGTAGCVSSDGSGGDCAPGRAINTPGSVTVSPDGASVYTTNYSDAAEVSAVAVFDRSATDGALTQKVGTAGCISQDGTEDGTPGECADGGFSFAGALGFAVSPDGKSAYVAADLGTVVILDRNVSGALAKKAGSAGCISSFQIIVNLAGCTLGRSLGAASAVTVSPDDASVYVAAFTANAVAIFDRDKSSGGLTQKAGTAGCVSQTGGTCADGEGLQGTTAVIVSQDNRNLYVAAQTADSVAIFDRDAVPETTITSGVGNGAVSTDQTPTFGFASSDAGSTFTCQLESHPVFACSSPYTIPTLAPGVHRFAVYATDPGGAADPTPAVRTFTVLVNYLLPPSPSPSGGGRIITGSAGADRLVGTAGNDVITCGAGNDVVIAGGGDDVINCGAGNDVIDAGAGDDRVTGGSGNDRITGAAGDDRLTGNSGRDRVSGGSGADRLTGSSGNDNLSGGGGRDRASGGAGNDRIGGGSGADRLTGGTGRDRISGNGGNDRISGNGGRDRLSGNSGNDRLVGGSGRDRLRGGSGTNVLIQ